MDISTQSGSIQTLDADAIVVNLFQGVTQPGGATGAVDKALDGAIRDLISNEALRGNLNETVVIYPRGILTWTSCVSPRLLPLDRLGVRELVLWPLSCTAGDEVDCRCPTRPRPW
jgi:leucyl aminopeptidase